MKISVKQYAEGLYEAAKNKSPKEIDGVISNFVKVLAKNNQLRLKGKIIEKFQEIYNRENNIVEAEITSREELGEDVRKHLRIYVSTRYKAEKVVLIEKVDELITGGIIIKVGDEVMDGSVVRQLNELKKKLSQ